MNQEIKGFREKWHISIEDLAKRIGVSRMTIYRWERSHHRPHSNHYEKVLKLMKSYKN